MPVRRYRPRARAIAACLRLESRRLLSGTIEVDRFFGDGVLLGDPNDQAVPAPAFVVPLPDERAYVIGANGAIGRVLPGGALDLAFSGDGLLSLTATLDVTVRRALLRPDGRLLIAATTNNRGSLGHDFALYQLLPDGSMDPSFGQGGKVFTHFTGGTDRLFDAALLDDGRIIAVGTTTAAVNGDTTTRSVTIRYGANGTIDSNAPGGGIEFPQTPAGMTKVQALPDGGYVGVGSTYSFNTAGENVFVRYDSNDALVPSFGSGGVKRLPNAGASIFLVDPQGGGLMTLSGGSQVFFRRISLSTGQPDITVGPDGWRVAFHNESLVGGNLAATLDRDRNIVLAQTVPGGLRAARLTTRGEPLSDVGTAALYLPVGSSPELGSIAVTGGNQVLVAGGLRAPNGTPIAPFSLSRLNLMALSGEPTFHHDGTDRLLIRTGTTSEGITVSRDGGELVVTVGGIEHRALLSGVSRLDLATGDGDDTVAIGDLGGLNLDVDLGDGHDVLRVGGALTDLGAIRVLGSGGDDRIERTLGSPITSLRFTGDAGADALVVLGTDGDDDFLFDDPTVNGTVYPIALGGVESVRILTGAGDDVVAVGQIPQGAALEVDAGTDDDTITYLGRDVWSNPPVATLRGGEGDDVVVSRGGNRNILAEAGGGTADTLRFIADGSEALSISGEVFRHIDAQYRMLTLTTQGFDFVQFEAAPAGTNSLSFDDDADTVGRAYFVTATAATRTGMPFLLSFTNIDNITIGPGSGNDTITSVAAPDVLGVGVNVSGGVDSYLLDRSTSVEPLTYTLTSSSVTVGAPAVSFNVNVEFATILGGSGDDRFTVLTGTHTQWTLDGGAGDDGLTVLVREASNPTTVHDSPGNGRVTFGNRKTIEFRNMEMVRHQLPRILSGTFDHRGEVINLDVEVAPTIALHPQATLVSLVNLTTGQVYSGAALAAGQGFANTLAISLTGALGSPGGPSNPRALLPDGNYRLTLQGSAVTDSAGNAFEGSFTVDFYVLAGDANRDRVVGFDDLLALAQAYGKPQHSGSSSLFVDFDRDGRIDFDDLLALSQRFGKRMDALPPTPPTLVTRQTSAVASKARSRSAAVDVI